jgi:(+)-trans-carveol dehydrogenase
MGRVSGKVAVITGAARGQGRSHAVRLAEEGASIIAIDICGQVATVPYELSTPEDLDVTVSEVEQVGGKIVAFQADVRDFAAVEDAVNRGVHQFGRLDCVVANAGIGPAIVSAEEMAIDSWQTMIDTNLSGAFYTAKAAISHLKAGGGGSITMTGSVAALRPYANISNYVAAKHGLVGLTRALALELAPFMIRVNSVHPTQVPTPMIINENGLRFFCPDVDNPTAEDFAPASQALNAMPLPWVEAQDISNAVLFLSSDEARYITGAALPVDLGSAIR